MGARRVFFSFLFCAPKRDADLLLCRHFVKEELPRIRWANPLLDISLNRVPKAREETWTPQATIEFGMFLFVFLFHFC